MNQHVSMIGLARAVCGVQAKNCPFCGEAPPLATLNKFDRYIVGCNSDDCAVNPHVSGLTISEAWAAWNRRSA